MSEYDMKEIVIQKKQKQKTGNSAEICFEGLGFPFELKSKLGGKIKKITLEDGYSRDGWEGNGKGQNELMRRGTFTLEVSVVIPKGNQAITDFEYHGCGGA